MEGCLKHTVGLLLIAFVAGAQPWPTASAQPWVGGVYQNGEKSLAERQKLAGPLLAHAEAAAAETDVSARSLLLYRVAGAWLGLDNKHAVHLYRQAFAAAQTLEPSNLRGAVEGAILHDLLPLSPNDATELTAGAAKEIQEQTYSGIVEFALSQGDEAAAIRAFDAACAGGNFPFRSASMLLRSLPANDQTGRSRVLGDAMRVFEAKAPAETTMWTASALVVQTDGTVPEALERHAIEAVLEKAKAKDALRPLGQGSISYGQNSLSYDSYYDMELFAVALPLKRLDAEHVAALLVEHKQAANYLEKYPGGLRQFHPGAFPDRPVSLQSSQFDPVGLQLYTTERGARSGALLSLDMGLEFTIPMNLAVGLGVTGSEMYYADNADPEFKDLSRSNICPPDFTRWMSLVPKLPVLRKVPMECGGPDGKWCSYSNDSPRARVLQALAERCTYYPGAAEARTALAAELQLLAEMAPAERMQFLPTAADLYLRLGDRKAAAAVVETSFHTAHTLLADDTAASGLRDVPKGVWPSAESFRRVMALGVNADYEMTCAEVEKIDDPVLKELERVMIARALLGVPVRVVLIRFASGGTERIGGSVYESF